MLKVKPYEQIIAERAAVPKAQPSIESISFRSYVDAVHQAMAWAMGIPPEILVNPVDSVPVNDRKLELQVTVPALSIEQQVDQLRVAADANSWDDPSAQAYAKGLQEWLKSGE